MRVTFSLAVGCYVLLSFLLVADQAPEKDGKNLILKHGTWVLQGVACNDAPNAAIFSWDGHGFSGAHSAQCVTKVMSQRGAAYRASTTCSALGDGAPAKPYTEEWQIVRKSATQVAITKAGHTDSFRWCSASPPK